MRRSNDEINVSDFLSYLRESSSECGLYRERYSEFTMKQSLPRNTLGC